MVEGARLESVYTATYRGFESLPLRQNRKKGPLGPFLVLSGMAVWMNPLVSPEATLGAFGTEAR